MCGEGTSEIGRPEPVKLKYEKNFPTTEMPQQRLGSNTFVGLDRGAHLKTPSFMGLKASSGIAKRAARGSSKKVNTRCELILQHAVEQLGLQYAVACSDLPGRPDLVFRDAHVVVFCDGDFWHGKDLRKRLDRLATGHNAPYWIAKIKSNVKRDRRQTCELRKKGWKVLRFWESQIKQQAGAIAKAIERAVTRRAAVSSSRSVRQR